jgi:hypothetical protein
MKHLKKFNNENEYNSFLISDDAISPNVSLIKNTNERLMKYHVKQDLLLKYTELEYIESTGSNYIELETLDKYVTDTSSNARYNLEIKTQFIEKGYDNHNQACIVGCTSDKIMFIRKSNTILQFRLFNSSVTASTTIFCDGQSINNTTIQTYDTHVLSDDEMLKQYGASGINENTLFLFCSGLSIKRFAQAKIYYFKFWQNNELVLDIVPVYNNATKQQGVYDKILNKFYPILDYTE